MDPKSYKQQLLEQLYAPYTKCMQCPLGSLGRTKVVFGEGNPDAQLMLIGEGPGKDEDAQGRPFVGRSGQLLTRVLNALDIERTEIFITNIVKCRPPENRKPFPNESKTCKTLFLHKQIKIICPKVICTLGASALFGLFEDNTIQITKQRGNVMDFCGIKVVPTFHPAYILRNPKELEKMAVDLELAKKLAHL